ncbi:TadE/TadG family type IV pilus assembly protein [Aureimonas ureilytica]|uniref:TadE/TadG family type IV pilus assembly protein n=1 Tax=Aureimonas ureilytica TaxID=401562 RepID=UPI003CF8DEDB
MARDTLRRRFGRDKGGVAAVEFALVAPLMLLLYLGASEATLAITASRKLKATVNATADLVAQDSSTDKSELAAELDIARALMQPLDSGKVKLVVSSILIDDKGQAKVDWSQAANGATARSKNSTYPLPPSLIGQTSRAFVAVEGTYDYTPFISAGLLPSMTMRETAHYSPRVANAGVPCTDCH